MVPSIICNFERRLGYTQLAIIKRLRKGTCLLAYRVELNIHFADSQPNYKGVVDHRMRTQWLSA